MFQVRQEEIPQTLSARLFLQLFNHGWKFVWRSCRGELFALPVIRSFGGEVNNAGVGTAVPATRETPEQFRSVLDVNLMGAYWMAQAFAKANKDGGVIVNISSILGIKPQGLPQAAYASSKAGLIGLTRDLAAQWTGRKKIRVNALAPGFFPSEMSDELPKEMVETLKMFAPAGRLGDPEELAATLIWLVSDASSYVTGITVPVDGGLVMP